MNINIRRMVIQVFKLAIKNNSNYIIPFLQGIKNNNNDDIIYNIGTMIVVNENGTLLTCKHIAEEIINWSNNKTALVHWFFDVKQDDNFDIIFHPILDLAIIKFKKVKFKLDNYPKFSISLPDQGQSICKLGYAFPNVDFFQYNQDRNIISIKDDACWELPLFPMDGIVTRHVNLDTGATLYNNVLFETSTPGLRGQSGGPIFGPDGVVYGIQSFTVHMNLGFNLNQIIKSEEINLEIPINSFINLGIGISSKEVIKFLEDNNIKYYK